MEGRAKTPTATRFLVIAGMAIAVSLFAVATVLDAGVVEPTEATKRPVSAKPSAAATAAQEPREVPEPATPGGIPKVVHLIWKTLDLPEKARAYHEEWLQKEPEFPRRITTDAGCRELANAYPGLQPHYDRLPLNVMRADVCRQLVVYAHGGVYMDLDIKWLKPLKEFVDFSGPIQLGYEQGTLLTNWFFAARKGDPCVKKIIDYIITRINQPTIEKNTWGNWVLHATGPFAVTHALPQCGPEVKVKWSGDEMTKIHISHAFGSLAWTNDGKYDSWQDQRKSLEIDTVVSIVWREKDTNREPQIAEIEKAWRERGNSKFRREHNPDFACRDYIIGNRIPRILGLYDRLPLNVMRAHLCKLVVLHLDGGVYMDADVSPGTQPMSQWIDVHGGLLLGWDEEGTVVADWFAAAPARNPVIKCMLDEYTDRLERADLTVKSEEDVDRLTGRAAFTKAALGCKASIRLSAARMKSGELLVHPNAAGGAWEHHERGGRRYRSWRREARAAAIPKTLTYVWWAGADQLPATNPSRFAGMEPSWAQRRMGAAECRDQARGGDAGDAVLSAFDRSTSDRARARLCGVMAVHRGGGLYLDSDAAYKEHITAWLNVRPEGGVVLAETEGPAPGADGKPTAARGIAPWVFAATPGHACMAAVRDAIVARILAGATGDEAASPAVFAEGAARCGASPTLDLADVTDDYLQHAKP